MPKKTEDGLKLNNARKQTHPKIQFYLGTHVTKENNHFALLRPIG